MQSPSMSVNWVPGITLEQLEKECILKAYQFYRQNKTQTAAALGIALRTLDNKLERYTEDEQRERERKESDRRERAEILKRMRGIQPQDGIQASPGINMEPAQNIGSEPQMPVPKRDQVQEMLPGQVSASGNRKRG